jgi:hypothetical protein
LQTIGKKLEAVQKIFDDYLAKGYKRYLSQNEIYEQNVFYLLFFTLVKEESTAPVGIAWDGSANIFGRTQLRDHGYA